MVDTPNTDRSERWHFAGAQFDAANRELRVDGALVHLESKPLEVLRCLLLAEGELVTKQELFEQVWAGRVVTDGVLSQAVRALRKALGDDSKNLIRTVHGHGFRLDAPIEIDGDSADEGTRLELVDGMAVPGLDGWTLDQRLQTRPSNELWRIRHSADGELGVLKLALEVRAERALRREVTLNRVLQQELGDRPPLAPLLQWQFEVQPYWIRMPWYPAGSLSAWLEAQGGASAVPLERRVRIVAEAAEALARAHAIGVMHKDIKPGNLLIDDSGEEPRLLLCDFGSGTAYSRERLARAGVTVMGFTQTLAVDPSSASASRDSGVASGTPAYTAPEILKGGVFSERSDVYSLGVLLYQVSSGELQSPLSHGWEEDVKDGGLRAIIGHACAGKPQRRIPGMSEFAEALRGWTPGMADQSAMRLSAIMFTDIVGYSSKVREGESGAREVLDTHRRLMRTLIPQHGGREIETAGDAFLIEFPSAVLAVQCAVAYQQAQAGYNDQTPEALRFRIRIGVHIGDVEHRHGKVFGHGVNYAARIEPLSPPGGLAVSPAVRDAVEARLGLPFRSIGTHTLKNVADGVELFALDEAAIRTGTSALPTRTRRRSPPWGWLAAAAAVTLALCIGLWWPAERAAHDATGSTPAVVAEHADRVALLPFELLGLDERTRQVMTGLQDALATDLGGAQDWQLVPGLNLAGLGLEGASPARIGSALRAGRLIRGSIQQSGDALRVNVQLIDAASGVTQWADSVRGSREALFELQDAIAQRIAETLGARGVESERPGNVAAGAYEDYLAAMAAIRTSFFPSSESPLALLDRALAVSPDFVDAHVVAATQAAYGYWYSEFERPETEQRIDRHQAALTRLGASEEKLALVDALRRYYLDFEPAAAAQRLAPFHEQLSGSTDALGFYASMIRRVGRNAEAIAIMKAKLDRDPTNVARRLNLASSYNSANNIAAAVDVIAAAGPDFQSIPLLWEYFLVFAFTASNDARFLDAMSAMGDAATERNRGAVDESGAWHRGDFQALIEAVRSGPDFQTYWLHSKTPRDLSLADALWVAERPAQEIEQAARSALGTLSAWRQHSDSPPRRMDTAVAYAHLGERKAARALIDEVLTAFPYERDAWARSHFLLTAIWVSMLLGSDADAAGYASEALSPAAHAAGADITNFCIAMNVGWQTARMDEFPQARAVIDAACQPINERNRRILEPYAQRIAAAAQPQD